MLTALALVLYFYVVGAMALTLGLAVRPYIRRRSTPTPPRTVAILAFTWPVVVPIAMYRHFTDPHPDTCTRP